MKFVDHKKRGWKSRNAYQNLWLGAQTSSYLYTWSYHTIILMILVCCISTYICRFLPDSPARCQGTLAIGWEALACSSHGGFSSLDVPFQYSLTLLKHVSPQFVHIWWLLYNYIYTHQLFIARYVYIYIYMHNSYIIMMERPLTCKLVTVSIAQTGCAAAQSHRLNTCRSSVRAPAAQPGAQAASGGFNMFQPSIFPTTSDWVVEHNHPIVIQNA